MTLPDFKAPVFLKKKTTPEELSNLDALCFPDFWNLKAYEGLLSNPQVEGWVLCGNGQEPLGFLCFQQIPPEAEIYRIGVLPVHQRKGLGKQLLSLFLAWCVEEQTPPSGMERIVLDVRASNLAAIALYQSAGFHLHFRREGYYSNPTEDALLLVLDF